jgi:hypothetical protein
MLFSYPEPPLVVCWAGTRKAHSTIEILFCKGEERCAYIDKNYKNMYNIKMGIEMGFAIFTAF